MTQELENYKEFLQHFENLSLEGKKCLVNFVDILLAKTKQIEKSEKEYNKLKKKPRFEYPPNNLSAEEISMLWALGDKSIAFNELDRVSFNIWKTLKNPNTNETIKKHIRKYLDDLISFDFKDYRASIQILFHLACMRISETPFIPKTNYIEALTSGDEKLALEVANEAETKEDFIIYSPISTDDAKSCVDIILSRDIDAIFLASFVSGVVHNPKALDAVVETCFNDYTRYSNDYWEFLKKVAYQPKSEVL